MSLPIFSHSLSLRVDLFILISLNFCVNFVYVGNLHKWAFVPRGCAVLWVHPDYQRDIFPAVTSLYSTTDFDYNFSYQGTDDNSQYYTAKTSLKFYQDIGGHVSD